MISCTIISHLNDYPCNLIDGSSPRAPFASSKWWQAGVPMPLLRAMIMMTSALRANLAHCLPRSLLSLSPAHGKQHFRRPFSHTRHRAERDFPVHKYSSPARMAKRYKAPVNKIHSIEAQTLKSTKGRILKIRAVETALPVPYPCPSALHFTASTTSPLIKIHSY